MVLNPALFWGFVFLVFHNILLFTKISKLWLKECVEGGHLGHFDPGLHFSNKVSLMNKQPQALLKECCLLQP